MEPTVEVENMDENKCKGDVTSGPLEPVPFVARVSVVPQIGMPATSDPNPDDRVKEDW
jgi:hypothetical protein